MMTIAQVNALSGAAFVAQFGFLFEHSPWVVEAADAHRPFEDRDAMHAALARVLFFASDERKLAVLRAHPKLADKAAIAQGMTKESASEQASVGLDSLSAEEYAQFNSLNAAYAEKFAFPFIVAVRTVGGKAGVLAAMRERLDNDEATERRTAIDEVVRIVGLRLSDVVAA